MIITKIQSLIVTSILKLDFVCSIFSIYQCVSVKCVSVRNDWQSEEVNQLCYSYHLMHEKKPVTWWWFMPLAGERYTVYVYIEHRQNKQTRNLSRYRGKIKSVIIMCYIFSYGSEEV